MTSGVAAGVVAVVAVVTEADVDNGVVVEDLWSLGLLRFRMIGVNVDVDVDAGLDRLHRRNKSLTGVTIQLLLLALFVLPL